MTIKHLRIFVAVFELKSITKAGEILHIAQPSVSLYISELEKYYGIKLFDRINKRLFVTEDGKKLYDYAIHIVGLFDNMENNMTNLDSKGVIKLGTSITIGNYYLPKILSIIKKEYPMFEVEVIIDNTDKIKNYILENKIDLGIIEGFVKDDNLIIEIIKDDKLIPVCALKHEFSNKTIRKNDVVKEKFLLREEGSASRNIVDKAFFDNEIMIKFVSVSNQAIINSVKEGIGISVLPYLIVKKDLDEGKIASFKIDDLEFKRSFSLIYHKNKYLSNIIVKIMGIIKDLI